MGVVLFFGNGRVAHKAFAGEFGTRSAGTLSLFFDAARIHGAAVHICKLQPPDLSGNGTAARALRGKAPARRAVGTAGGDRHAILLCAEIGVFGQKVLIIVHRAACFHDNVLRYHKNTRPIAFGKLVLVAFACFNAVKDAHDGFHIFVNKSIVKIHGVFIERLIRAAVIITVVVKLARAVRMEQIIFSVVDINIGSNIGIILLLCGECRYRGGAAPRKSEL